MVEQQLIGPGGATEVTLAAILAELLPKLEENGTVNLSAATLAALESINATVTGSVALDAPTLAALESIGVNNFPADYPLPAGQVTTLTPQTDALTDAELRAADVNVADSGERVYTHATATVSASGDTTVHTPAAGKRIHLRWIYAINDPASVSPPLIRVRLGATEYYRVWALSKRQLVVGAVDAPLIVNLSSGGTVAVTAILEEV